MPDIIAESITKIANTLCQKRGYVNSINSYDVEIVMEAIALLGEKFKEYEKDE